MKYSIIITILVGLVSVGIFASCCQECQDEFCVSMEEQIAAIDAKIKALQTSGADLGDEVKAEFAKSIEELEKMKEAAQAKFMSLKNAGSDAWQDLKPALNSAMEELEKGLDKASAQFKK